MTAKMVNLFYIYLIKKNEKESKEEIERAFKLFSYDNNDKITF